MQFWSGGTRRGRSGQHDVGPGVAVTLALKASRVGLGPPKNSSGSGMRPFQIWDGPR
jgi:hypothetical protein